MANDDLDICLTPGCPHPAHAHGLCRRHYDRQRNQPTPRRNICQTDDFCSHFTPDECDQIAAGIVAKLLAAEEADTIRLFRNRRN